MALGGRQARSKFGRAVGVRGKRPAYRVGQPTDIFKAFHPGINHLSFLRRDYCHVSVCKAAAPFPVHALIRRCMESEYHRVRSANDAPGSAFTDVTGKDLKAAKQERARKLEDIDRDMADKLTASRAAETEPKLARTMRTSMGNESGDGGQSPIAQVDGGDSPAKKKRKHERSRSRDRERQKDKKSDGASRGKGIKKPEDSVPAWKPKAKAKKVYAPISVNDPKFSQYVDMVVEAVNEDVNVKEFSDDPPFDAAEILKVMAALYVAYSGA